MIYKCCFCDFTRVSPNLNLELFKKAAIALQDEIWEDMEAYMREMFAEHGTKEYNGVKVHMGRKHKDQTYYGIWPHSIFSPEEDAVVREVFK